MNGFLAVLKTITLHKRPDVITCAVSRGGFSGGAVGQNDEQHDR